jgi:Leucine-rich repeat (LRR) protein
MLDVSNNQLGALPSNINELNNISVLNVANNPGLRTLPPSMGLLTRLWNLSLNGCQLDEPLRTMLNSKQYKTMDIVGYLKSVLEE